MPSKKTSELQTRDGVYGAKKINLSEIEIKIENLKNYKLLRVGKCGVYSNKLKIIFYHSISQTRPIVVEYDQKFV